MCTNFKAKADVAQNMIDDFFFLILTIGGPFHKKDIKLTKIWD